jgi:hypothetical protein
MKKLSPWLGRIVLAFATFIFTAIALRTLVNPLSLAAEGIAFTRPIGFTVGRIGFAAFPLGSAITTALCLFSPRRLFDGLAYVAIILAVLLVVRIFGIAVDHTLAESLRVTVAETVVLTLAMVSIAAEWQRRHATP